MCPGPFDDTHKPLASMIELAQGFECDTEEAGRCRVIGFFLESSGERFRSHTDFKAGGGKIVPAEIVMRGEIARIKRNRLLHLDLE